MAEKFKKARKSGNQARKDFNEIDDAIDPATRERWEQQEHRAMTRRLRDPSAMDVFRMKSNKGGLRICVRDFELTQPVWDPSISSDCAANGNAAAQEEQGIPGYVGGKRDMVGPWFRH